MTVEDEIITYCRRWRHLEEICKEIGLSWEDAREILDWLVDSGKLYRKLDDRRYAYANTEVVHECAKCIHYREYGDAADHDHDGICEYRNREMDRYQLYKCDRFQVRE